MIAFWGTTAGSILMTLLISMVPVLELRAAIPAGVIAGLDIPVVVATAIIGNLIPIPFIIVFIRKIFKWMQTKSEKLAALVKRLEDKADRKKDKVLKYEFWGLMFFVAIPLPGTGAWTGALIAAMLDMQLKRAFPAIAAGVVIAAVIVTVATYGVAALI
ncbi:MAG: small multi-drug export protein [Firmicutes bacterium]|nr:small multi-drug export protein [Bacillota bacterium]